MIVEIDALPWKSSGQVRIDDKVYKVPLPVAKLLLESRRRMHEAEAKLPTPGPSDQPDGTIE